MRYLKLIIIIVCMTSGFVVANAQNKEIVSYIDFLQNQKTHPVDYVFELFEKYDIVILGERDHRDISQYELISKIISDRRFIEKVGNIFTEIGVCNKSEQANKILKSDFESYGDFEKNLRQMYRNFNWGISWGAYNFWELLSSIYRINRSLPFEGKLNIFFTDTSFNWNSCKTREEYKAFYDKIWYGDHRDGIMGNNMIAEFEKILKSDSHRKKALVIYNRPHSYRQIPDGKPAAAYIFEKYPGRVANVMINWWAFSKEGTKKLLSDGKWDASFMYLNNPSLGFDFENSPFGNDKFDHYEAQGPVFKYREIYTGFIFYGGIHRWTCVTGIPDLWKDDSDIEELLRRKHIMDNPLNISELKEQINDVRNVALSRDVSIDSIKAKIYSWLEDDGKK